MLSSSCAVEDFTLYLFNDPCNMEAIRTSPSLRASICRICFFQQCFRGLAQQVKAGYSEPEREYVLRSQRDINADIIDPRHERTYFHAFFRNRAKQSAKGMQQVRRYVTEKRPRRVDDNDIRANPYVILRFHFLLFLQNGVTVFFMCRYSAPPTWTSSSPSSSIDYDQSERYHRLHFHHNVAYRYYLTALCYRMANSPNFTNHNIIFQYLEQQCNSATPKIRSIDDSDSDNMIFHRSLPPNGQGFGALWYAKWSHKQNVRRFWIHNQMCRAQTLGGGWASVRHPVNSLYYAFVLYRLALMIQDAACIRKCRLFLGYACLWSSEPQSSSDHQPRHILRKTDMQQNYRFGNKSFDYSHKISNATNAVRSKQEAACESALPVSTLKKKSLSIAAKIFKFEGKAAQKTCDAVQQQRCEAALFVLEHEYLCKSHKKNDRTEYIEQDELPGSEDHTTTVKPVVDVVHVDKAWQKAFCQAHEF